MPDRSPTSSDSRPDAEPGWKLWLEAKLGRLKPIQVVAFRSFGTPEQFYVRGRVVERTGVEGSTEETSVWRNILNTVHRLDSDEIPGARLHARLHGEQWEARTDEEGYFAFRIVPPQPLDPGWHEIEVELVESVGKPNQVRVTAPVFIPSPDAEFGVISDLDDTVIKTHASDLFQEIAIVFGRGAYSRTPFPGIPALYRALERGPDDRGRNPIFYVSLSGWNLYDLFVEFMDTHDIPLGPMFLSDLRVIENKSPVMGSDQHKLEQVDLLLHTYPELPFILIGDSGQHDPETYQKIVEAHPGRIRAVYIHDVSPDARDAEVQRIAEQLAEKGVPMIRAETTQRVAEHAAEHGCISRDGLDEVRRAVEREKRE